MLKISAAELLPLFSTHPPSLSKPGACITHNIHRVPTVWCQIWVCLPVVVRRDEEQATGVWLLSNSTPSDSSIFRPDGSRQLWSHHLKQWIKMFAASWGQKSLSLQLVSQRPESAVFSFFFSSSICENELTFSARCSGLSAGPSWVFWKELLPGFTVFLGLSPRE